MWTHVAEQAKLFPWSSGASGVWLEPPPTHTHTSPQHHQGCGAAVNAHLKDQIKKVHEHLEREDLIPDQ